MSIGLSNRARIALERVRSNVEGVAFLYCLGVQVLAIVHGIPGAVKAGIARHTLETWFSRRKLIVFFLPLEQHYLTVKGIPSRIQAALPHAEVVMLAAFPEQGNQMDEGVQCHYEVSRFSCRLMRASLFITPWVGFSRCSIPLGAKSIHPLISLAGLEGVYAPHHFDGCDYVFCASHEQIDDFRRMRFARTISNLKLVLGGYTKLDDQLESARLAKPDMRTIVYAPTHAYSANMGLATVLSHAKTVVAALLNAGFKTVFRPHPASFGTVEEALVIDSIVRENESNPMFSIDRSKDYSETYSASALMITDLSGTGFTFALSQGRPAIFFAPNEEAEAGLDGVHFRDRERIGRIVRKIDDLVPCIEDLVKNMPEYSEQIARYRDETIFNVGRSREAFVEAVGAILEGKESPLIQSMKMPDNA